MTILFKYLIYFCSVTFASKLICLPHIIFKYNRILQQASENYNAAFMETANGVFPLF